MIINPVDILHHDVVQGGLSVPRVIAPSRLSLRQVEPEVPDVEGDVAVITGKDVVIDEGREVGQTGAVQVPGEGLLFLEHWAGGFGLVCFDILYWPAEGGDGAGPGGGGEVEGPALQSAVHVEGLALVRRAGAVEAAGAVGHLGGGGQVADTGGRGQRLETLLVVIHQGQLGRLVQGDGGRSIGVEGLQGAPVGDLDVGEDS